MAIDHKDHLASVNRRGDEEDEDEDEDPTKIKQRRVITKKMLKGLVKDQHLYNTPSLNDKLYLHYHGFDKIEGLEEWTGLKALWLEGNGFSQIEGLDTLVNLRCIYLHSNCIKKIGGLECCPLLATLQLSNNFIGTIEGLSHLQYLSTLQIANNHLATSGDLAHLLECPQISVLDLQNNRLKSEDVVDVLEGMAQLAVTQLQGNPFVPKVKNYRRKLISRCRSLSYLDDRPVFEEERLTTDAWSIGDLAAEREERVRQREEKDAAHRRNLRYMKDLMGHQPVVASDSDVRAEEAADTAAAGGGGGGAAQTSEFAKRAAQDMLEEKMT